MLTNDYGKIQCRFEKDAKAFDSIYSSRSEFNTWFNRHFRKPVFERFDKVFAALADLKDKSVLDIGCGSGIYAVKFATGGARKILGVDFSQPMLDIAKARVQAQHLDAQCEFRNANFMDLEVSEKFNYAIAIGVFDYLKDPLPFLKKMKASVIDKVVISLPANSWFRGPLRKLRYLLTGKGSVYYYTRERIEALVQAAGFSQSQIIPMQTGQGFVLIAQP